MKQNLAGNFLLLAAVAYRKQKFDKAGSLFAAAMQSDDVSELLSMLDPEGDIAPGIILAGENADEGNTGSEGDAPRTGSLSAIARTVGDAMSFVSNSAADEGDEEDEDESSDNDPAEDSDDEDDSEPEDSDDEDQDDTGTGSDDFDPDAPGQKVIPSSLSSAHQGGGAVAGTKIKLVMGTARSPVRVK